MPEAKLLNCPTCGSSLSPDGPRSEINCEYCGNRVIVPPELREVSAPASPSANPVNIVMNPSGTSIQMTDFSAFQPQLVNVDLGNLPVSPQTNIVLPKTTTRWIKAVVWFTVIITIVSVVVPLICTFGAMFLGLGGTLLPFFLK